MVVRVQVPPSAPIDKLTITLNYHLLDQDWHLGRKETLTKLFKASIVVHLD